MHPNIELRVWRPDGRTPFDDIERSFRMTGSPPRNPGNVGWWESAFAILLVGWTGIAAYGLERRLYRLAQSQSVSDSL